MCGDEAAAPAARLSCGHALCAGVCSCDTASQCELQPCLALDCLVPRTLLRCPAADCVGFMPRETADGYMSDELRAAMAGPLRLAPLARGPYLRCFSCPLLLHRRRGAADAEAAGLRCRCGARTCVLRGGVEECVGRAHWPLSCVEARRFERIYAAWRPILDAARVEGEAARAQAQAALQALEPPRPARPAAAELAVAVDLGADDENALGGEVYVPRRNLPRLCLTAVATAVLRGGGLVDSVAAFLAAVPTELPAVLAAAEAACLPMMDGPEPRLRRFVLSDAPRAATAALQYAHAAVNAAETAVEVARGALQRLQVAVAENAAREAAAAVVDAEGAAYSACASANAASAAATRLGAADAEAAAGAAAVAAIAAEAAELLNVVRGHRGAVNDLLRDTRAAAVVPPAGAAGQEALTEDYLTHHTRPCPNCGVRIQKGEGECNSMAPCHNCLRAFCWSCLGPPHEHSCGPCSRSGDRAAVEAAIAAARPDANAQAVAAAMAMADAGAAAMRGRRRPPPRAARLGDAERGAADEAELVTLSLAATALRFAAAAGDAAGVALQLRVVRALLAELARAADAAERADPRRAARPRLDAELERDHERRDFLRQQREDEARMRAAAQQQQRNALRHRDAVARAAAQQEQQERQRALEREQAERRAALDALHAALDADAPVRAAAERAATALAESYDKAPGAACPRAVRDFPAAADAWMRMHAARGREAAAKAAAAAPPLPVQRVADADAAWRSGALALAAAEAAVAAALLMRLFDALRLPTAHGNAPLALPQEGTTPEHAPVRAAAEALELQLRAVGAACGLQGMEWPPTPEQAQQAGDDLPQIVEDLRLPAAIASLGAGAAALLALADGLAAPWCA